ncbi:hypothetical protein [Paenibacillus donghaensis]|uniref:Uncharacterized protein n=1 Tax=Paenibacillus donghaensis TaxID=414771 RepID=A0A2Z2KGF7_9BACL|nr:hypothetical protein [Paenibacillus donghaensis]ASA24927.1 hypothetical protein B9T62_31735 [Paenibacillus donghaensis]
MTTENDMHGEKPYIDINELNSFVSRKTGHDADLIQTVIGYSDEYINNKEEDENGEVQIDNDELIVHILKQQDIALTEKEVEEILEAELEFLEIKGIAVPEE